MNGFISIVSVFALGYAVLAATLFFYQPNLLYFPDIPTREIEATPEDIGLEFEALTLTEGIMPALESSHAIAYAMKLAPRLKKDTIIVVNLSGRGDKDIHIVADVMGVKLL